MIDFYRLRTNQFSSEFSHFRHIQRVNSIKDLKFFKPVSKSNDFSASFIASNVEKMLLFCFSSDKRNSLFLSEKPYLTQDRKLVYLCSDKKIGMGIFTLEDPALFGIRIISTLKNLYKTIYSEDQNPPEALKKLVTYIIDHENQLTQNMISRQDLLQEFYQHDFILKNFLPARISKSILLNSLKTLFQSSSSYLDVIHEASKAREMHNLNTQRAKILSLESLKKFLNLCTKDELMIFPAKKTLDSKNKNSLMDNSEYLVMNIVAKETKRYWCEQQVDLSRYFNKVNQFQLTEIQFSLVKKSQNQLTCIEIKLKTDCFGEGSTFLFFQQFYSSVLEKYTDINLHQPIDCSFEENLHKTKPFFRKQDLKLDFIHQIIINSKQNIIVNFIKAIDIMIIIYLVFEEIICRLREENYLEDIMDSMNEKRRNFMQKEIATDLYLSMKNYLEGFIEFRKKNFYFRNDF